MTDDNKEMHIEFHPDIWDDLKKMSPEAREEFHKLMESFQEAARRVNLLPEAERGEKAFNRILEELTGKAPEPVDPDELDEETIDHLIARKESKKPN